MKLVLLISVLGWRWLYRYAFAFSRELSPRGPHCESENIRRTKLGGEYICEDCEGIF